MAEDTEKRFQNIMSKLFNPPKSNLPLSSSSLGAQTTRGQKRPYSATQSNSNRDKGEGGQNGAQAPPCRPWDRGDLMRRLSTFKSMRWFAKPKAVDAVNCARRGWINVDMDIIACEVCKARLQFSTPSAWNQQQVEKAAKVFSLKLESGHKLLCPWIDNACDENLALFAPMPAPVLVDRYKERSSELLQLSALPVICASAIERMKSPQLEHFLKQSIAVECGAAPNDSSWTEFLGNGVEAVFADLYYQAHRLLSLCGWEPRLLPYVVDCEHQSKLPGSSGNVYGPSHGAADEQNNRLSVSMTDSNESTRADEDPGASSVFYDPNSTVLDCKLCGASIGLWAFATVPRPLELVRVVGYSDIGGGGNNGSISSVIENHANNGRIDLTDASQEAPSRKTMLNLTIAGGLPPTKQNFRATISLPVIGRSVRSRLSYSSSDVTTGEEGPPSIDAVMEGSTKDTQAEETDPVSGTGTHDTTPSTPIDDIAKSQEMPVDDTSLNKGTSSLCSGEHKMNEVADMANTASERDISALSIENEMGHSSNKMEFDPIKQHRHFCPWVASMEAVTPGWQQTLSALQKEKVFSVPDMEGSPSSPSLIKIDDPITSIRKLFESPPAKRPKSASNKLLQLGQD